MGGGDHTPPPQPTPMEQAQGQIAVEESQARRDQAQREWEAKQAAQKDAQARLRTSADASHALNAGHSFGRAQLGSLGFADTYGLMKSYNNLLSAARQGVPTSTDDVGKYFDYNDLWDTAVNNVTGAQRNRLDTTYSKYTPQGWENNYFADTSDDAILNAILGEQYNTAKGTMDAGLARGQLSQGAYDASLRGLEGQKQTAMSTLTDLGNTVLGGYRKSLDDIASGYSDRITNYKLGQKLDFHDMLNAFNSTAESNRGRLKGDIYRALGDTELFNTDKIIAKGNAAGGTANAPLSNAFRDQLVNDPTRTSGTTGVF